MQMGLQEQESRQTHRIVVQNPSKANEASSKTQANTGEQITKSESQVDESADFDLRLWTWRHYGTASRAPWLPLRVQGLRESEVSFGI